jgi:hypothetical protein
VLVRHEKQRLYTRYIIPIPLSTYRLWISKEYQDGCQLDPPRPRRTSRPLAHSLGSHGLWYEHTSRTILYNPQLTWFSCTMVVFTLATILTPRNKLPNLQPNLVSLLAGPAHPSPNEVPRYARKEDP